MIMMMIIPSSQRGYEIRAELVDMSIVYEPNLYAAAISNCAIISHLSMAMG
jgi:hypothetical protein